MEPDAVESLLARFFTAIEQGDHDTVAAMYHEDVQVWHSTSTWVAGKARSLAILRWLMTPGVSRRYELVEQHVHRGRVYRRHVLHVDVGGFETLVIPAAIFFTFDDDGLITAIDEYVDSTWGALLATCVERATGAARISPS